MHIHILGICGTFMGSLAVLAKELGHHVTGSDANVYPPMSTQLQAQGIELTQGYDPAQLNPAPDVVVIGNALSRGNPAVEYVLNKGLPYVSGPQWLADHVLQGRWVLAVAGTHGKTTTTSMLTWILESAGLQPGRPPRRGGLAGRAGSVAVGRQRRTSMRHCAAFWATGLRLRDNRRRAGIGLDRLTEAYHSFHHGSLRSRPRT